MPVRARKPLLRATPGLLQSNCFPNPLHQMNLSRIPKDYYGGTLMVLTGLSAAYAGMTYHIGTASQMGPGYLPCTVGILLAAVGVLIGVSARHNAPPANDTLAATVHRQHQLPDLRGTVCIVLGILAFLLFGAFLGLLPATFAIVFICAIGDRGNTLREATILALVMVVVAAVVFHFALQIQLPMFQWSL